MVAIRPLIQGDDHVDDDGDVDDADEDGDADVDPV